MLKLVRPISFALSRKMKTAITKTEIVMNTTIRTTEIVMTITTTEIVMDTTITTFMVDITLIT